MKWSQVEAGHTLSIKGETWKVVAREGDAVTMLHPTLGEKTGTPPPDGEVELIVQPEPRTPYNPYDRKTPEQIARYEKALKAAKPIPDADLEKLTEFAVSEGYKRGVLRGMTLPEMREYIHQRRMEQVAKDNDVPERQVRDAHVRLILGATVIAELRTGEPPATPEVDTMDAQTMRNHLHFFHDSYPAEAIDLADLVERHQRSHDENKETERHVHSVPF